SRRRAVVDAEVRAHLAQHRVETMSGEAGGHDRLKLERRSEEETLHRHAALVVVAGHAALRREAHGADAASRVDELGGENRTIAAKLLILAELLLDRQLEPIAGLDFGGEIDLAAEYAGQRQR